MIYWFICKITHFNILFLLEFEIFLQWYTGSSPNRKTKSVWPFCLSLFLFLIVVEFIGSLALSFALPVEEKEVLGLFVCFLVVGLTWCKWNSRGAWRRQLFGVWRPWRRICARNLCMRVAHHIVPCNIRGARARSRERRKRRKVSARSETRTHSNLTRLLVSNAAIMQLDAN